MTCAEMDPLLHASIDGELDAANTRAVEAHVAGCPACAAKLADYRDLIKAISAADPSYSAPAGLRARIEAAMPIRRPHDRRTILKGFAMGSALSAIAATGLGVLALRRADEQRILSDVVSAHLRSLQPGHLTDVLSTDQHTVKPWFNGRLDIAPPVVDLTALGFTLIGGRLDSIDGRTVAAVVYRRRTHVINLFVAPAENAKAALPQLDTVQGFHIARWSEHGLTHWAISDLGIEEFGHFLRAVSNAAR